MESSKHFCGWHVGDEDLCNKQPACLFCHRVTYPAHVIQEVLKQSPHMSAGVDLLHFYLCVYVTVVQEVYVGCFYLKRPNQIFISQTKH